MREKEKDRENESRGDYSRNTMLFFFNIFKYS